MFVLCVLCYCFCAIVFSMCYAIGFIVCRFRVVCVACLCLFLMFGRCWSVYVPFLFHYMFFLYCFVVLCLRLVVDNLIVLVFVSSCDVCSSCDVSSFDVLFLCLMFVFLCVRFDCVVCLCLFLMLGFC